MTNALDGSTVIASIVPMAYQRRHGLDAEPLSEDPDCEDHNDDKDQSEDCDRAGVHVSSPDSLMIATS
jgi:hypothetical protein